MRVGQLFTEYFLKEGIKNTPDYKLIERDENYKKNLSQLLEEIKNIYNNFKKRKSPDEADTEDDLIRPILDRLGFFYVRQKSPQKGTRTDIPDFILFSNKKDREEFNKAPSNNKPWTKPICILEGKRFERMLDKKDIKDIIDPSVPSSQILRYMTSIEIASNGKILWGILTNGRIWRLYYYRYTPRSEGHLEIDFEQIFKTDLFSSNNIELFKIFYLFFRKEAFITTNYRPHKTFLEIALEEGKRWEERVTEDLKERIFSDIFREIAQGFIKDAEKKGLNIDDNFLKEIKEELEYGVSLDDDPAAYYAEADLWDDIAEQLRELKQSFGDYNKEIDELINESEQKADYYRYVVVDYEAEEPEETYYYSEPEKRYIEHIDISRIFEDL